MPGYGMYLFNPGKRKKSRGKSRRRVARRKANRSFSTPNPMKTRRRRRVRSARRNPSRRRSRARVSRRNPAGRRRRRSMRSARRNPARRSRRRRGFFSRRNPGSGIIAEFTSQDMLATAGGALLGSIGSALIVDKLSKPGTMLPGLDPAKPTAYGRTIWKAVIAGGAGLLLRRIKPRMAEGLMLSAVVMVGNDVLNQSGVITQIRTAAGVGRGTGRYYPAGTGLLPGTSTRFTGPAQQFLRNNAPRPGMGARIGRDFVAKTASHSESAFTGAN